MFKKRSKMSKIVLVDDHQLMLDGLKNLLSSIGQYEVVATANSIDEGWRVVRNYKPDVLITDFNLGVENAFPFIVQVKNAFLLHI